MSGENVSKLRDLIEHIVRSLVDHPDQVNVTEVDGEKTVVFELRCHPDDIGKVIGRNGKTVSALRTLLTTAAARQNRRAMLEVVD